MPEVFQSTLEFLHREKVPVAYFNILCPEKGTMFYEKMKQDDRSLRVEDIGRFPGEFCHIKPNNFAADELERQVQSMYLKILQLAVDGPAPPAARDARQHRFVDREPFAAPPGRAYSRKSQ